jgi:hypothetical protein
LDETEEAPDAAIDDLRPGLLLGASPHIAPGVERALATQTVASSSSVRPAQERAALRAGPRKPGMEFSERAL